MKDVEVYLYDAAGQDEKVELETADPTKLDDKRLLWINVFRRNEEILKAVADQLGLKTVPVKKIIDLNAPELERYDDFFRFSIDSVVDKDGVQEKLRIDFIIGKNFVVTVHEGPVAYFEQLRAREQGETNFGEMDAESFVATLLDLNIVSYFQALDRLETRVDNLDEGVLKRDFETEDFLKKMVRLRRDVSRLRRWLTPQREVYYALSRADFQQIAESDSADQYKLLNQHFESAVEAVENARESVLSVFDLYATKSAQTTNVLIRRLTFFTLIVGFLAVVAGVFGMNYQLSYFEQEQGFWITVAGMTVLAGGAAILAWAKGWI